MAGWRAAGLPAEEAYACLVAVPVFKTGVGEDLVQVGSIPIRLRTLVTGSWSAGSRRGAAGPGGSRDRLAETLLAWLALRGARQAVADLLHVHTQTVTHRLGVLRELFGDALDDPDRRFELELALRASGVDVGSPA